MNDKTYRKIENYMLLYMKDSAHDAEHVYRVLYNALDIAKYEKDVDYDVLLSACLLHDIGRTQQFKDRKRNHAVVGGDMAAEFLKDIGFPTDKIEHIKQCILTHRYRSKTPPATLEAKILFDADKIDVAGAIGVARTLFYQGHVGTALYAVDEYGTVLDGTKDEIPSFFKEYNNKLKHIYDKCYTARADEIVKSRKKAMDDYCDSLLSEVTETRTVGVKRLKSVLELIDKEIVFRHAKRDELYIVAAFLDECWREAYAHILPQDYLQNLSTEKRHENFTKQYDSGSAKFLMMLDNKKLIGAAVYGKSITDGYESDGEISAVYLSGDNIGKGYGHKLFTETEHLLYNMGYTNLVLDVFSDNERAIRFYLKHGYEKVDDRTINIGGVEYPMLVLQKVEV